MKNYFWQTCSAPIRKSFSYSLFFFRVAWQIPELQTSPSHLDKTWWGICRIMRNEKNQGYDKKRLKSVTIKKLKIYFQAWELKNDLSYSLNKLSTDLSAILLFPSLNKSSIWNVSRLLIWLSYFKLILFIFELNSELTL